MQDQEVFHNFVVPNDTGQTFDDSTRALLLANSKAVHQAAVENQIKAENAPTLNLTFSLATPPINHIQDLVDADTQGLAHNSIELNSAVLHAMNAQTDKLTEQLPASLATVQNLSITSSSNNLPFDVEIDCKIKNEGVDTGQSIGSHMRAKLPSQNHEDIGKSLCVLHAGSAVHNPQVVHTASKGISNFETVCKYKDAMGFDPRKCCHIEPARSTKEVNYMSPLFQSEPGPNGKITKGDCFMELAFRNGTRFAHQIEAKRTNKIEDNNVVGSNLEVFMSQKDWNLLLDAYDNAITHPLQQSVCNLDASGSPTTLDFYMRPIINNQVVSWKDVRDTFGKDQTIDAYKKAHATCNASIETITKNSQQA